MMIFILLIHLLLPDLASSPTPSSSSLLAVADDGGPFDISELWGPSSPDANASVSEATIASSAPATPRDHSRSSQAVRASGKGKTPSRPLVTSAATAKKPARHIPPSLTQADEATSYEHYGGARPRVTWNDDAPSVIGDRGRHGGRPRPVSAPRVSRPISPASRPRPSSALQPESFTYKPEINPNSRRLVEARYPKEPGARLEQLALPRAVIQAEKLDKVCE